MRLAISPLLFVFLFAIGCGGSSGGSAPPASPPPAPYSIAMTADAPPAVYYTATPSSSYRIAITITNTGGANSPGGGVSIVRDGQALPSVFAPHLTPGESVTVYHQLWNAAAENVLKHYMISFEGVVINLSVQFVNANG